MKCFEDFEARHASTQSAFCTSVHARLGQAFCGVLLSGLTALAVPTAGYAHDTNRGDPEVHRELLHQSPLPDHANHLVTALAIELAPGAVVAPHRHGGFVYVYLLEGRLLNQMEGEVLKEYEAGQSWIEPARALHSQTINPSLTEPAKFLAVIYSEADAVITQPENDGD